MMNHKKHCLNCNETTSQNFCPNCGQKSDTQRITLKKFFAHDILHGMWHFEKGIFFTLKEALIRPGQAALDYISGKRIRYYNVFYLSLLVIALNILLGHLYNKFNVAHYELIDKDSTPDLTEFFTNNIKIILLSIVPILGFSSFIVFRGLKLNLAEHFVIGGMCLLGMVQMAVLFSFSNFLVALFQDDIFGIIKVVSFALVVFYPLWCFGNAIKNVYTFWGKCWRLIAFYFIVLIQLQVMLTIIVLILTNGKGNVSVNI